MRRCTTLLFTLLLALVVTACGSAAPAATSSTAADTPPSAEPAASLEAAPEASAAASDAAAATSDAAAAASDAAAAPGGSVVVALNREPDMLDPNVGSSRFDDQVHINIFNTPLYRDAELNFVPGLVTEWSVDDAGTTWTLKLRQGVTFHDGTPFDAEALKFNFDRIKNPETASKKAAGLLLSPETNVVDDYTVTVTYEQPYGAFLDALSTPVLGIISPASVEQYGADVGRNPVGTGPFKFVEWVAQDRIVLERNPEYNWAPEYLDHQGPAYLERLTFRFIPEDVSRVVALETGEVDAIINLPREQVARFEGDPAFAVATAVVVGSPAMMTVNANKPPTDNLKVRQAMLHAVNQQDLIAAALSGVGERAFSPISSSNPCYDPSLESKFGFDQDRSKALLAEAGWSDGDGDGILDKGGQPLRVEYITFGGAANRRTAEIIQAQMKEVGIDLVIREMESPAIQAARQAGEHNLAWLTWLGMDPAVMEVMLHSRNIGTGWNFTHFRNEQLDALLDDANTELDTERRCELYRQAQTLALDEGIIIPMYLQQQIVAYNSAIQGLKMSPHGDYIEWYDASKAQ